MHYIWTASHIDIKERLDVLKECITETQKFEQPHLISLSYNPIFEDSINELVKTLSVVTNIYLHSSPKSQFEHLEFLFNVKSYDDNDLITIIDDDDILFSLPQLNSAGRQYYDGSILDSDVIYTPLICYDPNIHRTTYDTSGTTVYISDFAKFFTHYLPSSGLNLCYPQLDLFFRATLTYQQDSSQPYVFRRMWNRAICKYWHTQ